MDGLTFVITGILESIEREEAADLIQRYGGKVTHSVSKKKSHIVMGWDPGESKLSGSKAHCNVQLKRGKKRTVNINILAAPFSLNFYNKSRCGLQLKHLGNLPQICLN